LTSLVKNTFPRSIELRTEVEGDLQLVMGDTTQLHQVFLNLCVNARDAMPQGGVLTIAAANIVFDHKHFAGHAAPIFGPYVWFSVSDTGIGIPEELLVRIFQPFFTTKTHGKGTGLGLSTVASIVRNHNGFIEVQSEVGKGSRFNVYLPAVAQRETPTAVVPRMAPPAGRGEQVLLVDDEQALLEMMRGILEANQYKVLCAKDGGEALALFQMHQREIKVVVTDLMMPVMDGPTLISAVKLAAPEVRIVCVSGLSSEAKLAELNRADVNALLRKPFTAEDLLVTLREVLG
jgi:CheY-like chemotaxis protein